MLCGESAIGSYGQKALSVLQIASSRMELWSREENRKHFLPQHQLGVSLHDRIAEEICNSAAELGKTHFSPLAFLTIPSCVIMKITSESPFGHISCLTSSFFIT